MGIRLNIAHFMSLLGLDALSSSAYRNLLFIFNYHRINIREGKNGTLFDQSVFGPSVVQLKLQLEVLQKHTTILSESEMIMSFNGNSLNRGPYSMVTFDDAYRDNYDLAMPILLEVGIPAIFFVPTLLIENRTLGWWDKIAFILQQTKKDAICFRGQKLDVGNRKKTVIKYFQEHMKHRPAAETENLVDELAEAADSPPPSISLMDKELMDWEQLKNAHDAGITIGSHACTHRVLSTLTEEEQAEEIGFSKKHIEKKLNIKVRSLAFPVGGVGCFNEATLQLTRRFGYDMAFSFETGEIARVNPADRYAIPRVQAPRDLKRFQALLKFPMLTTYL